MDVKLFEARKGFNSQAEFTLNRDVREYHKEIGDYCEKTKTEKSAVEVLAPDTLKLIAAAQKKYPFSRGDPPAVQKAIGDYNDALRVAREICERHPALLQNMIDRMENVKPETFKFYSPKILAHEDKIRIGSLLNGSKFLKNLPAEIARLEVPILDSVGYWSGREEAGHGYKPDKAAIMSRQPESGEGKTFDKFDPRL